MAVRINLDLHGPRKLIKLLEFFEYHKRGRPDIMTEPSRNPSSARITPEQIVSVARGHFFIHGFRGVTMHDLAEELGMSKKTLYEHFPSKATLVEAVILHKSREIEADLARITSDSSAKFPDALHYLLACVQGHLEEIRPPFVRDVRRDAPEVFKQVESLRRDLIHRYFGKLIGRGRRAGVIRKDISARLITEILLETVQAIMNPEKLAELKLTPKTGFSSIIAVILHGVITETGRSKI